MKLSDWLKTKDMTAVAFAELAELSPATISRAMSGERRPEWPTLDAIMKATNGEVTPNDFVPEAAPSEEAANG